MSNGTAHVWNVDDAATTTLLTELYRGLERGLPTHSIQNVWTVAQERWPAMRARSASETMPTSRPSSSTTGSRRIWVSCMMASASSGGSAGPQLRTCRLITSSTRISNSGLPAKSAAIK